MQKRSSSDINFGVDLSHYQGKPNWAKVKAAGVKFALIKSTEGATGKDEQFINNVKGAKQVGIPVGYYHYARPENNHPDAEVNNLLTATKDYPDPVFGYILDIEGEAAQKLGKTFVTSWCRMFLELMATKTKRPLIIYTGAYFARDFLGYPLRAYPLWIATYGSNDPVDNTTWSKWSIFQYSSTGNVDGISGNVDLNVMDSAFYNSIINPTPKLTKFTDVPSGHYAEQAIANMSSNGILNGITDTQFGLGQNITREQMAVILDRLLKLPR